MTKKEYINAYLAFLLHYIKKNAKSFAVTFYGSAIFVRIIFALLRWVRNPLKIVEINSEGKKNHYVVLPEKLGRKI